MRCLRVTVDTINACMFDYEASFGRRNFVLRKAVKPGYSFVISAC